MLRSFTGSLVIVDAGLAVSFTRQSKVRLSLFNNDLLIERDSRRAQSQGARAARSRSEIPFSAFVLKFSTRSRLPGFVTKRPRSPSPPRSTVTFGYIRIKKGGITQGDPRCRFSCQNSQSRSCSLSADSPAQIIPFPSPERDAGPKNDCRYIIIIYHS